MPDHPSKEFLTFAKEAKNGKAQTLTVRELLGHFGQERRGREVSRFIRYKLGYLGLETDPRFEEVHIDSTIQLIQRPKRPRGRPRKVHVEGAVSGEKFGTLEIIKGKPAPVVTEMDDENAEDEAPRPYLTIGLLASANRKPHSIRRNDTLEKAITLMLMHDISHVPVIQGERSVEGLITWRSIGRVKAANRPCSTAAQCMDTGVPVLRQSTSLFDAVREIVRYGVVLVQARDKTICGIVTAKDIADQFVALSEPFLFLEQIENHLRSLLKKSNLKPDELRDLVDPADATRRASGVTVDGLTFGEYLRGLSNPSLWGRLGLGIDRNLFVQRLDAIRRIRNSVMHFHPDGISAADRDVLAKTREMLQGL